MTEDDQRPHVTIVRLERLFRLYPNRPLMREAVRNWLRELARTEFVGVPLTGAYYWVPMLGQNGQVTWQINEFFDHWLPSSDHVYVWRHVRDYLQSHWQSKLKRVGCCSLPRGRVCRPCITGPDGRISTTPVIYHGNDCPLGAAGFEFIRSKFNLDQSARSVFDVHEQMLTEDAAFISQILGIDLGGPIVKPKFRVS